MNSGLPDCSAFPNFYVPEMWFKEKIITSGDPSVILLAWALPQSLQIIAQPQQLHHVWVLFTSFRKSSLEDLCSGCLPLILLVLCTHPSVTFRLIVTPYSCSMSRHLSLWSHYGVRNTQLDGQPTELVYHHLHLGQMWQGDNALSSELNESRRTGWMTSEKLHRGLFVLMIQSCSWPQKLIFMNTTRVRNEKMKSTWVLRHTGRRTWSRSGLGSSDLTKDWIFIELNYSISF